MSNGVDKVVDRYFEALSAIFEHVGYAENWRVLPIDDHRDDFWAVDKVERAWVKYSAKREALVSWLAGPDSEFRSYSEDLYEHRIYTQRHLPKWVYRGTELTLVVADTQTDGNKLLQLFRNANEVKMGDAVNEAIDRVLSTNKDEPVKDRLKEVQRLCKETSIGDLRVAIEVHRANCHQPSCPVLAAMEEHAATRGKAAS